MPGAIDRRAVLAGLGAVVAVRPESSADGDLRAALDRATAMPADAGLRSLATIGQAGLSLSARLDLGAARAGLAIDAALMALGARPLTPVSDHVGEGRAIYALRLQRGLGNGVDPASATRRLTRELQHLLARANRLFARIGQTEGSVGARYTKLWREADGLYPDDESGRDQAVADMNRTLQKLRRDVGPAFGAMPGWCLDASIRRLSPAEQAAGRGGYRIVPTPTQPGAYVVDLGDIRRRPRWTLPSVVAHETLPGHLLQLGLEGEASPHPLRLIYARAFVEGWAIQAETLAARAGFHDDDPRVELGHVHWLVFRVGRALADLGIHVHGWTIAEARARLVKWQGEPAYFAPFETELLRIPQEPASRAAEALAWLAIADTVGADPAPAALRAIVMGGRKRIEQVVAATAQIR